MTMTVPDFNFSDAEPPTERLDSIPPVVDVEAPCSQCGNEAGLTPTGRKRKFCQSCRPATKTASVRVTGNAQTVAAQAAKVLSNINAVIAMGLGGFGFVQTMMALGDKNESFEQAAYSALLTDPKLCQQILSVGQVSAKASLTMAYLSLGMGIAPVLAEEYRAKKARALADMES